MKKNGMINLIVSAAALCAAGCMRENPVDKGSSEGGKTQNELSVAARTPIGSAEPVTDIGTLAQLRAMRTGGNYRLIQNIDASATQNTPFVPIGFTKDPFRGTFDGGNFTINNLKIVGSGNTGMFSWAVNADFKNIRLTNVTVTGGGTSGAIAGYVRNVDLKNGYVSNGTVTGNTQGGSVGMVFGSAGEFVRISRCYATGTVNGWGKYVGGFIGYAFASSSSEPDPNDDYAVTIREVYTKVDVNPSMPAGTGTIYAGGLVGYASGANIEHINSFGNVTGRNSAGGLVGHIANDNPGSRATVLWHAISHGMVTDAATPQRTGTIGTSTGQFSRCSTIWNTTTDTGTLNPNMSDLDCQVGFIADSLKAPRPDPGKRISPFTNGNVVTQAAINAGMYPQCQLASGHKRDWGFGTCGDPVIWALNSSTEYITLTNIPNPTVQPKI